MPFGDEPERFCVVAVLRELVGVTENELVAFRRDCQIGSIPVRGRTAHAETSLFQVDPLAARERRCLFPAEVA